MLLFPAPPSTESYLGKWLCIDKADLDRTFRSSSFGRATSSATLLTTSSSWNKKHITSHSTMRIRREFLANYGRAYYTGVISTSCCHDYGLLSNQWLPFPPPPPPLEALWLPPPRWLPPLDGANISTKGMVHRNRTKLNKNLMKLSSRHCVVVEDS